jgi:hypothetical protein
MEWQPIETAPKGQTVLVYGIVPGFGRKHPRTVRAAYYERHTLEVAEEYEGEDWAEIGNDGCWYMPAGWYEESHAEQPEAVTIQPTHWMPLPPPPKEAKE